jgi:hypothetical protein
MRLHTTVPGIQSERTTTLGTELHREELFRDGIYVGTVVYVRRKRAKGGSDYGWRPERNTRAKLTTNADAIRTVLAAR